MSKLILYDFWAPWCPPCRAFGPKFEAWEEKHGDKADFIKVNIDENAEFASKKNISSIPTVILADEDGNEKARWVGIPKEADVLAAIEAAS